MALSGSVTGGSVTEFSTTTWFTFSWTAKQSVENNTSEITYTITAHMNPTGYHRGLYQVRVLVWPDGLESQAYKTLEWYQAYSSSSESPVQLYNNTEVISQLPNYGYNAGSYSTKGKFTVQHNADGTAKFGIECRFGLGSPDIDAGCNIGSTSDPKIWTLDTILRNHHVYAYDGSSWKEGTLYGFDGTTWRKGNISTGGIWALDGTTWRESSKRGA